MSIFNQVLSKINETYSDILVNFQDDLKLQNVLEFLDKFETENSNSKAKSREVVVKTKNALKPLQSINEDEDETKKTPIEKLTSDQTNNIQDTQSIQQIDTNTHDDTHKDESQRSKKRSKNEVEDMYSPEQDKRPKRNASVRAQSNISKQVNVNLTQKLRRDESDRESKSRSRRGKDKGGDKENTLPIQIKQEKISLPLEEPMEVDVPSNIEVKQERNKDDVAMPPPAKPLPKPRGRQAKEKNKESSADESGDEAPGKRKTSRSRKQNDAMPPPPVPVASTRSTRASSRASSRSNLTHVTSVQDVIPAEGRPKRTRAKKVTSQSSQESDDASAPSAANSPQAEKPRPKRTRRGKAAEKQEKQESPKQISPKEERISEQVQTQNVASPILTVHSKTASITEGIKSTVVETKDNLEETRVISGGAMKEGVICDFDKTVVLPNGKFDHISSTPKATQMNETVVLERLSRGTYVMDKKENKAMDATVIIERVMPQQKGEMTEDNSILTDDNSQSSNDNVLTPPVSKGNAQPASAVKEKVQQFEELANRVTRTKTRAMAKKEEPTDNHTPPDKVSKAILCPETLTKMNGLIFNQGKTPQVTTTATKVITHSLSASKPIAASASKPVSAHKRDTDLSYSDKEDARRKKEALLEAKREANKRKREDKMAAAAAARLAAERERELARLASAQSRSDKLAHATCSKAERAREAEKKKLELARKAAETEERRRVEERARQERLIEEQKREAMRRKQQDEADKLKKETAMMAKEIEKRHREYIEKEKLKQKMEAQKVRTPLRDYGNSPVVAMAPVYMADGFQYLNSDDDDDEQVHIPAPWSSFKNRNQRLTIQASIKDETIDRLFSVRVHSPDLRAIFPQIDRRALKRTSSAVWRTPNRLPTTAE